MKKSEIPTQSTDRLPGDLGFNGNFTAVPKGTAPTEEVEADPDLANRGMEYDEMNLADAKASGYTNKDGKAVDMAKTDVEGSPTGAFTDIGAGRSSAVHPINKDHKH